MTILTFAMVMDWHLLGEPLDWTIMKGLVQVGDKAQRCQEMGGRGQKCEDTVDQINSLYQGRQNTFSSEKNIVDELLILLVNQQSAPGYWTWCLNDGNPMDWKKKKELLI